MTSRSQSRIQTPDRLVLIEAVAAGGLLAVLAVGAWLVLRRGLRPLERMAATGQHPQRW